LERVTEAGAVFETNHRGRSALRHHRHGAAFATIVLDGAYVEVRDSVPEVCRRGTIVVHATAEEHADRFANDTHCLNVEFPADIAGALPRGIVAVEEADLRDAVESLVRSFYGGSGELSEAVRNFRTALVRRPVESQDDRPHWLHRVIREFPWEQAVPLREAAAAAGVHETHFSRAFRHHVGMTAKDYRARARLRLASELLLTTDAPIARIALNAGFSDQSHLTRIFSERLGLSPAGYRRTFAR
jgi:AraC-like DNA-binding protein